MKETVGIKEYAQDKVEVLVEFLRRTTDGEYARIEMTSIPFARIEERTLPDQLDETEHYYGLS